VKADNTSDGKDNRPILRCVSYNCKGFKQVNTYLADLLCDCDILCLTETWLRPGELSGIKLWLSTHPKLKGEHYDVFAKSSMETVSDDYIGRPFGGIAVIVRKHPMLNVQEIECLSERVLPVVFKDHHGINVQMICNIYMPYFDSGNINNTTMYIDTIDVLQALADKYSAECPVKYLGDFNCQLPVNAPHSATWYRGVGFNKHSFILHNFINANCLKVVDMAHKQGVKYTYFCHKRNVYTWLDHVLCSYYDFNSVLECKILSPHSDNDSDHLPVLVKFRVNVSSGDKLVTNTHKDCTQYISWKNESVTLKYKEILSKKLNMVNPIQLGADDTVLSAQNEVDRFMSDVTQALHMSAAEASNNKKYNFKPKPYWCPELSKLRDKKRFWWHLWVDCGRPRQGSVYDCYKGVKKMFRRTARDCMNIMFQSSFNKFNELYYSKNLQAFWQYVKRSRKKSVNSILEPDMLASHYEQIMSDDGILSAEQIHISESVDKMYDKLTQCIYSQIAVSAETVSLLIDKLNSNCAPGIDGVTSEHLKHGKSGILCNVLSQLYTCCLSWQIVPSSFNVGVIVPILKKPSLNPNDPGSYRPVTLSSVFSKIIELIMLPQDRVSDNQFGFRKERGTSMACALFNDIKSYFEHVKSPLFTCSLDAQKCFDSIWHKGLFFKLKDKIPNSHWVLLYRWYKNLKATIKWNGTHSRYFPVSRGTRQGSLLSPQLFNIFIDNLLRDLCESDDRVCIGNNSLNTFAYADDINLLCTTAPGLQRLIDMCVAYAKKWRFRFGINKTKCMIISGKELTCQPRWYLENECIENVNSMEILGVMFDSKNELHVDNRINKCKRAYHSLRDVGMAYPGSNSDVKAYLWRSICQPVLLYGSDAVNISKKGLSRMESTQGNLIKQCLGLSHRARSTSLLQALCIPSIKDKIKQSIASLLRRAFTVHSPCKDFMSYFLSLYISRGQLIPGISPTHCAFNHFKKPVFTKDCGVIDSIRALVMHTNFIKPYSEQHVLTTLLTKSF